MGVGRIVITGWLCCSSTRIVALILAARLSPLQALREVRCLIVHGSATLQRGQWERTQSVSKSESSVARNRKRPGRAASKKLCLVRHNFVRRAVS